MDEPKDDSPTTQPINPDYYSNHVLNDYIAGNKLSEKISLGLLNSEDANVFKSAVANQMCNNLHGKIAAKRYIRDITVPEGLSVEEQNALTSSFAELNIKFSGSSIRSHAYASASRKCERAILLGKISTDTAIDQGKILIKDVGGNIVLSALNGEKNVHCCSPVLDPYDNNRLVSRVEKVRNVFRSKVLPDNYTKSILESYIQNCQGNIVTPYYCFNKSEDCNVQAETLLLLHSNYDIPLRNLGDAMDKAKALSAYGSFIFSPEIFTSDAGTIPILNAEYQITRTKFRKLRNKIKFSFINDAGFNYCHDYNTYISYLTKSQFKSTSGKSFTLELLENRNGIQFFKISRMLINIGRAINHKIHLQHLTNRYIVRFPYFNYESKDVKFTYPYNASKTMNNMKLDTSFWKKLPKHTEWITYIVDKSVIDKANAYVLGATEEKFKPDQIITYLRSILTREVFYSTTSSKQDLPEVDALVALCHAIYINLYQKKYIFGKGLQQAVREVNSLRSGLATESVLSEFDQYNRNFLIRFLQWLFNCKPELYDSRKLILTPADYIEFETSEYSTTRVIDYYDTVIDTTDLIITSELLAEETSLHEEAMRLELSPVDQPVKLTKKQKFLNFLVKSKNFCVDAIYDMLNPIEQGEICVVPTSNNSNEVLYSALSGYELCIEAIDYRDKAEIRESGDLPYFIVDPVKSCFKKFFNSILDFYYDEILTPKGFREYFFEVINYDNLTNFEKFLLIYEYRNGSVEGFALTSLINDNVLIEKEEQPQILTCYLNEPPSTDNVEIIEYRPENLTDLIAPPTEFSDNNLILPPVEFSDICTPSSQFDGSNLIPPPFEFSDVCDPPSQFCDSVDSNEFLNLLNDDNKNSEIELFSFDISLTTAGNDTKSENSLEMFDAEDFETNITIDYPRYGFYDPSSKLINVDGTKNECCFLALCEDREVDLAYLRNKLLNVSPRIGLQDIKEETTPGNMAGSAVLMSFSENFHVDIIVKTPRLDKNGRKIVSDYHDVDINKIPYYQKIRPFRTMILYLENHHYYFENTCKENYPIKYRRDKMFEDIDLCSVVTQLKEIFPLVEVNDFGELTKIKKQGIFFFNNLKTYCNIHEECRNNKLRKFVHFVKERNSTTNCSILLLMEKSNFCVDHAIQTLSEFPGVNIRFVDLKIDGYFPVLLYNSSTILDSESFKINYSTFIEHDCHTKRKSERNHRKGYSRLDQKTNIIYTCRDKGIIFDPTVLNPNPDLLIDIVRTTKESNIIQHSTSTLLRIGGYGSGPLCDNMVVLEKKILEFLGRKTPSRYYSIQVNSVFSNIGSLITALKTICDTITYQTIPVIGYDSKTLIHFVPNDSLYNMQKNSMLEMFDTWNYENATVINTLAADYQILSDGIPKHYKITIEDNSVCCLDTCSRNFVYGQSSSRNSTYAYGYSSKGLISTSNLFDVDGNIVESTCKSLMAEGNQYIVFSKHSKLVHSVKYLQNYSVKDVNEFKEVKVVFIQGVPGAGKTQYILDSQKKSKYNVIFTVTREAKLDMISRASNIPNFPFSTDRILTIDSYLVNRYNLGHVEDIWIDEALLVHCGSWMWLAHLTGCQRLIVVGDSRQIPYQSRSGYKCCFHVPEFWKIERTYLSTDYRNPLDIVYWLHESKFYDFNVDGTSNVTNSVLCRRIIGVNDVPRKAVNKYLVFTQSEKDMLRGYNVNTVHEYQGNQSDHIILVRLISKATDTIYDLPPYQLVALTRHRKSFLYMTVVEDNLYNIVKRISRYTKQQCEKVRKNLSGGSEFIKKKIQPDSAISLYLQPKNLRNALIKNDGNGYIPWTYYLDRRFPEFSNPISFKVPNFSTNTLQEFYDRAFPGASTEFREHDHYNFEYGVNFKPTDISVGFSMPIFKNYDRLQSNLRTSIQFPLHSSQKISLKAFFERNGQVPNVQGDIDHYKEANLLMRDFLKLCPDYKPDFLNNKISYNIHSLQTWVNGQPPAILKIINAEESLMDQDLTVYDFIIKSVPKIDLELGAEHRYKSPQTIAFQKKTLNSVFCPILKDMMDRIEFSLDERIVLYNNMSAVEFAKHFTEMLPPQKYSRLKKFFEIDFSKYDKSQGLVILIFEALIMRHFGVPEKFVKMWILMHRLTTITDRVNKFSAKVEYQRKSGDAGTWRLNTIVQIAVLNRVLKLHERISEDNCVACFSGDDSLIFTDRDFYRLREKTQMLPKLYNLEAKLLFFKIPYFCSKFLIMDDTEWLFIPDTLKLITKLGRNDLVDFQHVECYRVSFNDNLYYYKFKKNWPYISLAINDRYHMTGEHDYIYEALLNVCGSKEAFACLYGEPINYKPGNVSTKPSLEL